MTPALETLFQTLLVAASCVGFSIILRNAPWIRDWVQAGKKPWACNVCLPMYVCAVLVAADYFLPPRLGAVMLTFFASYALSHVFLEKHMRPPVVPKLGDAFWPEDLSVDSEPPR